MILVIIDEMNNEIIHAKPIAKSNVRDAQAYNIFFLYDCN